MLIATVAIVLLGAGSLYLFTLARANLRAAAVAERTHAAEMDLFRARIAEIADRRSFEKARTELSWNGFRKFEIVRKVQEGGGVCSFYLAPHDKKALPPFEPGQYLTFRLNIPGQPKPVIRCYSLSDGPRGDYFRVSIKKVPPPRDKPDLPPGLSSSFFHDQLNEGDILDVKAPSGGFRIDMAKHNPVVLIGGGIGITPVLSMLNAVTSAGLSREVWFFLGVRNRKEHVFKDHLIKIALDHPNVRLHVCYSDPDEADRHGVDYHHPERVSIDLFKRLLPSNNYDFYFCGPPPMMNSLAEGLQSWNVPETAIHYEAFGPATVKKVKAAQPAPLPGAAAPKVTFVKSGKTVDWAGSAGSLLELAEANGVAIDFGCRAGNCGTCLTAIREGNVRYVTEPGDKPEAGSCLACVSVPEGDIALNA